MIFIHQQVAGKRSRVAIDESVAVQGRSGWPTGLSAGAQYFPDVGEQGARPADSFQTGDRDAAEALDQLQGKRIVHKVDINSEVSFILS